jgi:hypothetical protein
MDKPDWVIVERFQARGPEAEREKRKWENIADDIALIPENNVRLVEDAGGVRVEVSRYLNDYFKGSPGMI